MSGTFFLFLEFFDVLPIPLGSSPKMPWCHVACVIIAQFLLLGSRYTELRPPDRCGSVERAVADLPGVIQTELDSWVSSEVK